MSAAVVIGIVLLVLSSAFWVAIDSEKYDWTLWTHPGHPEWNCAADSFGTWFIACALLWPVFFPGYFFDRRFAPRKSSAQVSPPLSEL